jgi:murein DD-endopeptidase MepM/ murein hydrolase activator NlpD
VPVAVLVGLALLFALPLASASNPPAVNDVLGALATPAPAPEAPAATRDAAAVAALTRLPDPGGQGRTSARRVAPSADSLTGYAWPLRDARLTLPFGPTKWGSRVVEGELFHDGIDLATRCGDRITAAHAGVVLAAGRRYDWFTGWLGDLSAYTARLDEKKLWSTLPIVVVIDDGNDYRSIYAHFGKIVVAAGDVVEAGDLLGYEGRTGRATGCHLHYGLFSPDETAVFGMEPTAAAHMLLPTEMIARVDPLRVLPPLEEAGIH